MKTAVCFLLVAWTCSVVHGTCEAAQATKGDGARKHEQRVANAKRVEAPLDKVEMRYDADLNAYKRLFTNPDDFEDVGVLVVDKGRPQLFVNGELLLHARDEQEVERFLGLTQGRIVEPAAPTELLSRASAGDRIAYRRVPRAIRLDVSRFDLAIIEKLGPSIGIAGRVRIKDARTAQTIAAALHLASQGYRLELDAIALPQQSLLTVTREAAGKDAFGSPGMQSGLDATGQPQSDISRAWQLMRAAGISQQTPVAIIDSGFALAGGAPSDSQGQADFPNLQTWNIISGNADASGENVMTCGGNPCPWHGYQAASVALARADNSAGVAGSGGFFGVPIFIRIGGTAHQQVLAAWQAYLMGARVMSLSTAWNCDFCSFGALVGEDPRPALQDAVSWFEKNGVVVVAAAGNDNEDVTSNHVYPCRAATVCVGATMGAPNTPAPYSNYGSSVTLFAPTNIDSLVEGGSVAPFGGTSAAAPLVAGVIAMMQSVDPNASVATIRAALLDSAWTQPIAIGGGKVDRWLNAYGAVLQMLNWRIRDDDTEADDPYRLDLSGGRLELGERTLHSGTDVDRYQIVLDDYSKLEISFGYMQRLNWASFNLYPGQPVRNSYGIEGVSASSSADFSSLTVQLAPVGEYTIEVRGGGPNLYDLVTKVTPVALQPDVFDIVRNTKTTVSRTNDSELFASDLKQSIYQLTLHTATDVDFLRCQGGRHRMLGLSSEFAVDVQVSDSGGVVVADRSGVTSAVVWLPKSEPYLVKVSGSRSTRYMVGCTEFDVKPKPLKLKFDPKRFDPSLPIQKVVLGPAQEVTFPLPRNVRAGDIISVTMPGEIEIVGAKGRPVVRGAAGQGGVRSLVVPVNGNRTSWQVRVSRDDRLRSPLLQPPRAVNVAIQRAPEPSRLSTRVLATKMNQGAR